MLLAICDVNSDRFISILYLVTSNELITHAERTVEESWQNYCKLINGTPQTRKWNYSLMFTCAKHCELMFLICTQEVPGLHFRWNNDNPKYSILWFPQSLHTNASIVHHIMPRLLHSITSAISIYLSPFILCYITFQAKRWLCSMHSM